MIINSVMTNMQLRRKKHWELEVPLANAAPKPRRGIPRLKAGSYFKERRRPIGET